MFHTTPTNLYTYYTIYVKICQVNINYNLYNIADILIPAATDINIKYFPCISLALFQISLKANIGLEQPFQRF